MAQQSHFTDKTDYHLTQNFIIKKPIKKPLNFSLFCLGLFIFLATIIYPNTANAGPFSFLTGLFNTQTVESEEVTSNSQTMSLLKAAINVDPNPTKIEQLPAIMDNSSLFAEIDPNGNNANAPVVFDSSQIVTYVVRSGDTLPQIAKTFGVTAKTIMIANDMVSQKITEGQRLIILPVSGVQHTVKKGETLSGIAKLYGLKVQEILEYNHFESVSTLTVGDDVFIPTDNVPVQTQTKSSSLAKNTTPLSKTPMFGGGIKSLINDIGYFIQPLVNYHKTQSLHGRNGIDLGAKTGEPILAAASGQVLIARGGWNGGYGNYVVIQHGNGTQTVYGHASKLLVTEGQTVKQGQTIALVGSTGNSTGPHLHVEVRGGINPF